MTFHVTHVLNDYVDIAYDDQQLLRYTYEPKHAQLESPRPYFHPMYTLNGDLITGYRPNDHRWHHGLSLTFAYLSDENFWGGKTFTPDKGYVQMDNNGSQRHRRWHNMIYDANRVHLDEVLTWFTQSGTEWIDEERSISIYDVNPEQGYWTLDFQTTLTNISRQTLVFGSPTTQGRHNAGYGGFFLRGARDFTGGKVMIEGGPEAIGDEEALMGKRGRWMAYSTMHDGTDNSTTLLFIDHPTNPRYPNKWFMRAKSVPMMCYSFMFDEEYELEADAELSLHYQIVIANGIWDRERIQQFLTED